MKEHRFTIVALAFTAMLLLMLAGMMVAPSSAATPTPTLAVESEINEFQNVLRMIDVTFVQTSTVSGAADLYGMELKAIEMPSSWVSASLTFQSSSDCSSYVEMYDDVGDDYEVVTAAGRHIIISDNDFSGVRCLKVRSGTAAVPVTQTTSVDLTLILKPR